MSNKRYQNSNSKFYHSKEWQAVRTQVLERDSYLCQVCKRAGRITPASTVHHIKAVRVDPSKRLDASNLETICRSCHNREHTERAQSLRKKQTKIKATRRRDMVKFSSNPEMY